MSLSSSNNPISIITRGIAAVTIIALLITSTPFLAFAQNASSTNNQTQDTQNDTDNTDGSSSSSNGDGGGTDQGDADNTGGDDASDADGSGNDDTDTSGDASEGSGGIDANDPDKEGSDEANGDDDDNDTGENNEGDDGTDGTNDGTASVNSGDAGATSNTSNTVNTNTTTSGSTASTTQSGATSTEANKTGEDDTTTDADGNTSTSTSLAHDDTASTTGSGASATSSTATSSPAGGSGAGNTASSSATSSPAQQVSSTETVANDNTANVANEGSAEASSGGNAAHGGGDAQVSTGNAFSFANVVNVVNTNLTNSSGLLLTLNKMMQNSNLDLRGAFHRAFGSGSDGACSLSRCGEGDVSMNVMNTNTATVTNKVISRAVTGENAASSTSGNATVATGDASAGANVVNVANTNILNSNYLLLTFNNLSDLAGDIVLPGKDFFEKVMKKRQKAQEGTSTPVGSTTVANTNTATVTNNVSTDADTGGNVASSTGGQAAVSTGDAAASAGTHNQVNTNVTGGAPLRIMFRVFGDWSGEVFGTPDGLSAQERPGGVAITGDASAGSNATAASNASSSPSGTGTSTLSVSNTNTAHIANDVQVEAITGDNRAMSEGGTASVQTGNATAVSNVANVVNTNVLSENWALLLFNIFGDWDGNVAFGQPDLWVGATAHSDNSPVHPGSDVTYTFTIANRGDADATGVTLAHEYDPSLMSFPNGRTEDGRQLWDLGRIGAGETIERSFTGTVGSLPFYRTPINSTETVSSDQNDANAEDNTDTLTVVAKEDGPPPTPSTDVTFSEEADIDITKTTSATSTVEPPQVVNYEIVLTNDGGPAYHSTLIDTITGPNGNVVHKERWQLGTVRSDEEITVSYGIQLGTSTMAGTYTNHATLDAVHKHASLDPFYGSFVDAPAATTSIVIASSTHTGESSGKENEEEEATDEEGAEGEGADEATDNDPKEDVATSTATTSEAQSANSEALQCSPYVTDFMRHGAEDNQAAQVEKLQMFLKHEAGFTDLEVTGTFDRDTHEAVEAFQQRYAKDILHRWGVDEPTGYVYLTTRKKINEIHCDNLRTFELTEAQKAEIARYKQMLRERREENEPLPENPEVGVAEEEEALATRRQDVDDTENEADAPEADENEGTRTENTFEVNAQTAAASNAVEDNSIFTRAMNTVTSTFTALIDMVR